MIRCKELTWDDMTGCEVRANTARMVRHHRRALAARPSLMARFLAWLNG